jgi:hypothetical protein
MSSEPSVRTEFHTHHASPQRLFKELEQLLGPDARFTIDMRHNVYEIETNEQFNIDALYERCKPGRSKIKYLPTHDTQLAKQ